MKYVRRSPRGGGGMIGVVALLIASCGGTSEQSVAAVPGTAETAPAPDTRRAPRPRVPEDPTVEPPETAPPEAPREEQGSTATTQPLAEAGYEVVVAEFEAPTDEMSDVTRILGQIETGDPSAAEQLLPLVYDELRRLAAARMAQEQPGQTLQATALVHEAYMRLVDVERVQHWNSRGHFFSAAAEAMRRILVESFRHKQTQKHGGDRQRVDLMDADLAINDPGADLLALNEAIDQLTAEDAVAAELAKLRIFAGLSVDDAAQVVGLPHTTAYRQWTYAQAWLRAALMDAE